MKIKITRIRTNECLVPLPTYKTKGAAAFDLHAALTHRVTIRPGQQALIPTGLILAIPEGFEGQVRPRSGLALKQGLSITNSPGTIDSDFRGEIGVILINFGQEEIEIGPLDRIAQMAIAPVVQAEFELVDKLDETARGSGGFGSTGA